MGYTHGKRWTDRAVKESVLECARTFTPPRMPTSSELKIHCGASGILSAIQRMGGLRHLSEKYGLVLKECETKMGWIYEDTAENVLIEKGFGVEKMSCKEHFDFLINDVVKVDIKSGKRWFIDNYQANTFGINKRFATCDIYMIFALDEDGEIERTLIIPSYLVRCKTTMCIGENSKYDEWIDRYDIIEKYSSFLKSLRK